MTTLKPSFVAENNASNALPWALPESLPKQLLFCSKRYGMHSEDDIAHTWNIMRNKSDLDNGTMQNLDNILADRSVFSTTRINNAYKMLAENATPEQYAPVLSNAKLIVANFKNQKNVKFAAEATNGTTAKNAVSPAICMPCHESTKAQCTDTPTPLPASIEQMCSGNAEALKGCEGAEPGCEYYRWRHNDFVERHKGCPEPIPTPPSYYLEYGEKYCNKFTTETMENLTPEGQAWLEKTRCNLQQGIEKALIWSNKNELDIEKNGEAFETMAFETHSAAYLKAGLADLGVLDLAYIAKTPDLAEWGKGATWKQAGEVLPDVSEGLRKRYVDPAYNRPDGYEPPF